MPEITFVNDNMLVVDGKHLQTQLYTADRRKLKVSPDDLETVLSIGKTAIHQQIELAHQIMKARYGDQADQLPSMWSVQMIGPRHDPALAYTEMGLDNGTGIMTDALELRPPFRDYWHAIERAGLVPEARRSASRATLDGGAWLLARLDQTPR